MSGCDLDLIFHLALVILTFKILSKLYLEKCMVIICHMVHILVGRFKCAISWCDL